MKKAQFITERTRIISEMLDNPDECGIYPTTECFKELDTLFDNLESTNRSRMVEFAGDMVYQAKNPKSKMCTPNVVYIAIEKKLQNWRSIND